MQYQNETCVRVISTLMNGTGRGGGSVKASLKGGNLNTSHLHYHFISALNGIIPFLLQVLFDHLSLLLSVDGGYSSWST